MLSIYTWIKFKSISFLISPLIKLLFVGKPRFTFLPVTPFCGNAKLVLFLVTGGVRWFLAQIRVGLDIEDFIEDYFLKTYSLVGDHLLSSLAASD